MTATQVRPLRHAIVGVGASVLEMHRPAFDLPSIHLVGVSDLDAAKGRARAAELDCAFYSDHREMLAATQPDVAIVLTPHPFHAAVTIGCLEAGCHVLVEKPMAVDVAEADAMIAAAERTRRLLAVNLQHRCRPAVRAARKLIDKGALGALQHINMTVAWPRTAAYYRSAGWRATWRGEGGGVLMNQAPHNLDLLCYLLGRPVRVTAWTRNLLHRLEVEDTAQAMLEWGSGTLGSLHVSTAETGRPERLEMVGTRGYMQLKDGALSLELFETDFATFATNSADGFAKPASRAEVVSLEAGEGNHAAIYENLHAAILHGAPLVADGVQGRMSLELANAMTLSSHTRSEVELPLDVQRYGALLEDLKVRGRVVR
ncbi:Gfo/Idh/MocA family oxidoreductase [soil metagenome]